MWIERREVEDDRGAGGAEELARDDGGFGEFALDCVCVAGDFCCVRVGFGGGVDEETLVLLATASRRAE